MASIRSTKELALELAHIAQDIKITHGDYLAQIITYGTFIKKCKPQIANSDISEVTEKREIEKILDIDLNAIFSDYLIEGKDPAIYFYEEFLRAYDRDGSRKRGVHYSPPSVVSYIVRGINYILKDKFAEMLDNVLIFDPCCGMGAFLNYSGDFIDFQPKLVGAEIMPVPYEFASTLLPNCEIFHADSLDGIVVNTKGKLPVVLGNPPYSGHSANAGKIVDLLNDYKYGLSERNPKWIQDDYVKFIRMAENMVVSAGKGIVAFITNHSYLSNPTFRAMRSHLMHSFDEVYVLDLHGNSKRAEKTSEGMQDESIFSIQMGVGISFMIRTSNQPECSVKYASLKGTREDKFAALSSMEFNTTPWVDVNPTASFFVFTPQNNELQKEYYGFHSLFDIFEQNSVGFVTSRDAFAVDFDRDTLLERISLLRDEKVSAEKLRSEFGVGDLDIEKARYTLQSDPAWQDKAMQVLYRPFDFRWAYYSKSIMERPRLPFMENLMNDNIALTVGRNGQATGSDIWDVVFCTDKPTDLNIFRRGGASLFPRWIYEQGSRKSNIKMQTDDPDKLFYYIYALLHSNIYRNRYCDMLKIDYPRIPIVKDRGLLDKLAALGSELINAHLMRDTTVESVSNKAATLYIGGYDIPRKYIKDRKHHMLTLNETITITHIRSAIIKTIEIQECIDDIIRKCQPWNT